MERALNVEAAGGGRRRPSWAVSLAIYLAAAALMGVLRLYVFDEAFIPLTYGLPLLVCIWHRDARLLWAMVVTFAGMSAVKAFHLTPGEGPASLQEVLWWGLQLVNILTIGVAVHAVMLLRTRIEAKNALLEQSNAELTAANEELAAREEEISRQNEELQSQAEELRQQNEELQAQTEELEQQGEELQAQSEELRSANEELGRRERMLHALLESARSLSGEQQAVTAICRSLLEMLGDGASAAAVVEVEGEQLVIRAHAGFPAPGPVQDRWPVQRSFAALVMEKNQTGFVENLELRPDLQVPQSPQGAPLRSVLASPVHMRGKPIGAVEVYGRQEQKWTAEQFRLVEWVAGQCSLILEATRLQRELEQRRKDAEEGSARKTQFLAGLSHDIRTPANAITLMAELITRAAHDPASIAEIPEMVRELQANSRSLVELVSDVLDMARLDSGRYEMNETSFQVRSVIEAEVRQLLPMANAKCVELVMEGPGEDLWVRTDRMKLARVLANLIGNAIKFTEVGQIRVATRAKPAVGVEIQVMDSGVGIAPEHMVHIFDEFTQLRNPERDRTKGTGLGLAICKRLAQAMGCDLTVRSEVGKGSTFTFTLCKSHVIPAPGGNANGDGNGNGAAVGASVAGCDAQHAPLAGLRVLLVEDHETTRRATAKLLMAQGAVVMQAPRGKTAMQMLAQDHVEVLLLDLMLPDIDGREVLKMIQQRRPPTLRRVLAVTGDATSARLAEVKQLGADDVVFKPIQIDAVVAKLAAVRESSQRPA